MEVYDRKRNRFEEIEDRTQNNKYLPLSHCINKNKGDLSRNAQHGKNSIYTQSKMHSVVLPRYQTSYLKTSTVLRAAFKIQKRSHRKLILDFCFDFWERLQAFNIYFTPFLYLIISILNLMFSSHLTSPGTRL